MVLSEAGASGMAIISTNVAAIPEFVRNGETGLMVPAGDAASLTQALRDLATNPALRMTLGERAMAHVTRHYDAPTNASRLLGLLKAEADAARAEGLRSDIALHFLGACAPMSAGADLAARAGSLQVKRLVLRLPALAAGRRFRKFPRSWQPVQSAQFAAECMRHMSSFDASTVLTFHCQSQCCVCTYRFLG